MAILSKGQTFANGDQVTATKLNNLVDAATFASGAVDGATTQLSGGAIIVKDSGITAAKLESASNGQLLIGNGSGFTKATLTAGSNVTITNSAGGITIAASGGGGGGGTIVGSTGSTDNRLIRADGTGGSTIQSSAVTVDDSGNLSGAPTVNVTTSFNVNGTKVVGARGSPIASVGPQSVFGTGDDGTINANNTAIFTTMEYVLAALRTHGLIST